LGDEDNVTYFISSISTCLCLTIIYEYYFGSELVYVISSRSEKYIYKNGYTGVHYS